MNLVVRKPVFAYANNKDADQPAHQRRLISVFVIHCLDSIISLVSIPKISNLWPSLCGCPGWLVSYMVANPKDRFPHDEADHTGNLLLLSWKPKRIGHSKNCCYYPKNWTLRFYRGVMPSKDADRMANSVDPDKTVLLGPVWSWSTLFTQICQPENLGSLWKYYFRLCYIWGMGSQPVFVENTKLLSPYRKEVKLR